jgi:hypothetical protein
MASMFDALGIQKEMVEEIKPQKAGGSLIDSGLYKAKVKELYIYKTDSEANMLQLVLDLENDEALRYSTCVKSGNSNADANKHFKTTYTRNGKEFPLPGVIETKHLMQALKMDDFPVVEGKVKRGDEEINALTIPSAVGKELMVGIRQEEGDGEYGPKNFISAYLTIDGENATGDYIADKIKANIAKNPVKRAKGAKAPAASSEPKEAPKGWA